MAGFPKLIVLSEQLRGQVFDLKDELYTIGRSEKCTICIPDPTISGAHCKVEKDAEGNFSVADTGSTNGTRVNGNRVESQRLANSDIVQIGGVELLFESPEKSTTTMLGTKTGILLDQTASTTATHMTNFSPFGSRSDLPLASGPNKSKLVFKLVIGVLVVALVGILVWLLSKIV
ncbi:MAG: FHA domain-containing protein [Lentisphaeria bacterium]